MASSKEICRILVADDNPIIRRLLFSMLGRSGHVVEECDDGRAALNKLASESYSLLIVDQNMPVMTGSEVIKALRAQGVGIPIILVSGCPTDENLGSLENLESVAILGKPFTLVELKGIMRRIAPMVKC